MSFRMLASRGAVPDNCEIMCAPIPKAEGLFTLSLTTPALSGEGLDVAAVALSAEQVRKLSQGLWAAVDAE